MRLSCNSPPIALKKQLWRQSKNSVDKGFPPSCIDPSPKTGLRRALVRCTRAQHPVCHEKLWLALPGKRKPIMTRQLSLGHVRTITLLAPVEGHYRTRTNYYASYSKKTF
eukprot:729244-Amphidinium_carterae.1